VTTASYVKNRSTIRAKQNAKYAADPVKYRAQSTQFRKQHPEYFKAYLGKYYLEHKDQWVAYAAARDPVKARATHRAYREANLEKVRAGIRDWFRRHPHVARLNAAKYRARLSMAENTLTEAQVDEILEVFNHRCGYCLVDLRTLPKEHRTLDHLLPIVRGGGNTADNVVPCCKSCNSRKGHRNIVLMAQYIQAE
jgi:5-methylcytosine-specific restriction endonuclease McrA